VLCVLPFEPAELDRLGGPPGVFVGHRLTRDPHLAAARAAQKARAGQGPDAMRTLLVLPGSRRGEVSRLSDVFGETIAALLARGHGIRCVVPTLPKVEGLVRSATANWPIKPEIVLGEDAKWRAFGEADAALAASGTVTLELALAGVPLISCYRLDNVARLFTFLLKGWSASLPNLIADTVVVPELYNQFLRPTTMSRHVEAILGDTPLRQWQLQGFAKVRQRLETERPAGELAAEFVLATIDRKPAAKAAR
jgi:lipid-A-disaccharide synthase